MIRRVRRSDGEALADIYRPYVLETSISFEVDAPDAAEMERRIEAGMRFPWYVEEVDDKIVAYAYASKHRERAAYQWAADVSVYTRAGSARRGSGRRLYERVLDDLRALGYANAFAVITLPNDASVGFHEAMGFVPVGVYRNVGFKHGHWHDVGWWQLPLRDNWTPTPDLTPPRPMPPEQ
ncbi:GNAT family N-acetyltransferase [Epidermidibacterium keratini]|uniref:GNAT family N-acetyltransferase n=1 Tax=Epidermidibacterium keratini TaxID=1891644 RepID=A0A7L4YPJ8_9ACTN|nr:GNAT family N-acetyltransferase [Epidermidibacterium keratini]QHC00952.1 GNAT family N-acetyltransferase [Epidermidibacterium keratini]